MEEAFKEARVSQTKPLISFAALTDEMKQSITATDHDNRRRSFRLDAYGPRLDVLARSERTSSSKIVRKALAAYMDGAIASAGSSEQFATLAERLVHLRKDLARVSGDLNQISFAFNLNEILHPEELERAHRDLKIEVTQVKELLKEILDAVRR